MPDLPTTVAAPAAPLAPTSRPVRIGVVSFLNTAPLIDGLDDLAEVELRPSVPSLLLDQLESGTADVALASSIDYQRCRRPLVVLPVGQLGCDGPTLTVRLYAAAPIESVERVWCDTDSHTSVALLRILMAERYGREIEVVPYHARERVAGHRPADWPDAMLLIGDKVVTDSPPAVRYPHQLDLGEAWRELTGLPFVFACWMAPADLDEGLRHRAAMVLDRTRRRSALYLDAIVAERTRDGRWPRDLAGTYLREHIRHAWTERSRIAVETFHALAHRHGLVPEARPLVVADPVGPVTAGAA